MIEIVLDYPPSCLLPNASRRRARQLNAASAKVEREAAFYTALPLRDTSAVRQLRACKRIPLTLLFYPTKKQRRADLDGLHAAMKAAIDGVAQALEINDRCFAPQTVDWGEIEKPLDGKCGIVIVQIGESE